MISKEPQSFLHRVHKSHLPARMVYLDTETKGIRNGDQELHRMIMAWTCYVHRRGKGKKPLEAWRFWDSTFHLCDYLDGLARPRTILYIFGHNLFFDLQVSDFFYYFTKWGWGLDFVYEGGTTFVLIIHKENRTIKAISTTNYFDVSVKEIGKMVGLEKMEVDFENVDSARLKEYCRRDVEIIKLAMERYFSFITINDLGRFSLTRASQAMIAYRHRFMRKKIYIHHDQATVDLERASYMGGRVECFRIGKQEGGPFLTLDINSMFPYVMKNVALPSKFIDYQENLSLPHLKECLRHLLAIAEVEIQTEEPLYAVRHNDKIVFPVGSFRAFLCTPLLQEAIRRGHLLRCLRASFYKGDYLFPEYVDFFYGLKRQFEKEGNLIFRELAKNFLNYLCGKFAQTRPKTTETESLTCDGYWREEAIDLVTGEKIITYKLLNKIVTEEGKEQAPNTLIALSSHITEWARYILYNIIAELGFDKALYCDTDSIKIRKRDIDRVKYPIDPGTLGSFKIERENNELVLLGPKSYYTESERHIKGIPTLAKPVGEKSFEFSFFPKLSTHMRERRMREHVIEKMVKTLVPEYDKGTLNPDGSISPLRFFL